MDERQRITRMLRGERVDMLPWATRLDIWHKARLRWGTLPPDLAGQDLMAIHRRLGLGRQSYVTLVESCLRGVERLLGGFAHASEPTRSAQRQVARRARADQRRRRTAPVVALC